MLSTVAVESHHGDERPLGQLRRRAQSTAEFVGQRRGVGIASDPERLHAERRPERGPVAIGGVGGSGTRVVAEIVRELGFYIGDDLNGSLDNLWFTLLFKRPAWYRRSGRGLGTGIEVFRKAMSGEGSLTPAERAFLLRATLDMALRGHGHQRNARGAWAFRRARSMRRAHGPSAEHLGWGWKEPNTHLFLEALARSLPGLRYIHMIRHGLHMAHSRNQFQLYNWGPMFGVERPRHPSAVPPAPLRYWARANTRAMELGPRLLGTRFHVVRYESMCADPRGTVRSLAEFLGVEPAPGKVEELAALVKPPPAPSSAARSVQFAPEDLAATERLGFEV